MKIGIVTEYYYPSLGGITEHVHHFSVEAKKIGHEPVIITADAGDEHDIELADVDIIKVGKSLPIYSNGSIARVTAGYGIGRKVKEILKSEKFDILHIHAPFVPTLPLFFNYFTNTATIGTFHTHFSRSFFMRILRSHIERLFDRLDGKIAVSKLCVESMNRYFVGDYRIIPNGVDTEKFRPELNKIERYNDGKVNIFFLSRMEPRSGLDYLIKAFLKIKKENNNCRLVIGGDGPLRSYYKSLVPRNAADDIHFIGKINGHRPSYYSTSDIFCFPTTKASFGIPILEAMASGKPVIAFSMPAYHRMVQSGREGILCGPPGIDNLVVELSELIASKEKRSEMGKNARRQVSKYSWSRITREIIDFYEEITSSSS